MKSERMRKISHLCLRLGQSKAVRNGGIAPMCLRSLRRKPLREVWDIVPMGQCDSAFLCPRLCLSKDGIAPTCLRQLRSKALREGWDIVTMVQWESAQLCLRLGQI